MTSPLTTSTGTLRPMLVLALPVLAEETLTLLVGYTDWWLTGHYLEGPSYKAAMGLMAYSLWLLPSLFSAVGIGATALIARFSGAGDHTDANRVANQAIVLGIVFAALGTLGLALLAGRFVTAMQLEPQAASLALQYLWILLPAIPFIMIEQIAAACLRGAGDTVSGFVAKSIVNVVNIGLSFVLVLGVGPFPQLGWQGLAIGTACGHAVGGLILLVLLIKGRSGLRLGWKDLRIDPQLMRRLLRIGLPGGCDVLAIITCHLIYVAIINSLGTAAAAAHGLGIQIEALAYLPGSAFHVAAATMAGQYLGAKDPRRATRSVMLACLVGGSIMSTAGLVFYFGGSLLTTFFTGSIDDPTGLQTTGLLRIVAFSMPSLALVMILNGALRGSGDTLWPLLFTFLGYIGVRIPGACWLAWESVEIPLVDISIAGFGLGVAGAWYAMVADVVFRSLLVVFRFWQGGWRKTKV